MPLIDTWLTDNKFDQPSRYEKDETTMTIEVAIKKPLNRFEIFEAINDYLLARESKIGSPKELTSPAPNVIITSPLFAIFVTAETTSSIDGSNKT